MDALKKNLRQEHVLIHDFLSTFYTQVCYLKLTALLAGPVCRKAIGSNLLCLICPQKHCLHEHIFCGSMQQDMWSWEQGHHQFYDNEELHALRAGPHLCSCGQKHMP